MRLVAQGHVALHRLGVHTGRLVPADSYVQVRSNGSRIPVTFLSGAVHGVSAGAVDRCE